MMGLASCVPRAPCHEAGLWAGTVQWHHFATTHPTCCLVSSRTVPCFPNAHQSAALPPRPPPPRPPPAPVTHALTYHPPTSPPPSSPAASPSSSPHPWQWRGHGPGPGPYGRGAGLRPPARQPPAQQRPHAAQQHAAGGRAGVAPAPGLHQGAQGKQPHVLGGLRICYAECHAGCCQRVAARWRLAASLLPFTCSALASGWALCQDGCGRPLGAAKVQGWVRAALGGGMARRLAGGAGGSAVHGVQAIESLQWAGDATAAAARSSGCASSSASRPGHTRGLAETVFATRLCWFFGGGAEGAPRLWQTRGAAVGLRAHAELLLLLSVC